MYGYIYFEFILNKMAFPSEAILSHPFWKRRKIKSNLAMRLQTASGATRRRSVQSSKCEECKIDQVCQHRLTITVSIIVIFD